MGKAEKRYRAVMDALKILKDDGLLSECCEGQMLDALDVLWVQANKERRIQFEHDKNIGDRYGEGE